MRVIVLISICLIFSTACNDVEFDRSVQGIVTGIGNSTSSSTGTDPNFDENGNYIDNEKDGTALAEIQTEIDPDKIGEQGESVQGTQTCIEVEGTKGCYNNSTSEVFVGDSFERNDIAPVQDNVFGWRSVINDNGKVITGTSTNNVEFKSYDDSVLGETSAGDKSLYFTGRAGAGSVHNLYLITKSFNLSETNGIVYFSFDYLPIGLDAGEYLRLEVCNDTLDNCGVGNNINVAGLNGRHWKPIFESNGKEVRSGLNGHNHLKSDWINKQLAIRLDGFQRENFVFRINAYMNEGFYKNNPKNGVDDAIGIDNFKAFTFLNK